ncbi:MAG: long-chain-fatty-acid--CoA ligase [Clostridia bacterium]|nr:long-chain-fatty-acid--CoA ligase [Clostridia bacterium]
MGAPRTLPELLAQQAMRHGDKTFLIFRERTLDYAGLHERTGRVAAGLAAAGVKRDDRVVLSLRNRPETLEALMAVMKAGAVAVPTNPSFSARELGYVIGQSGASAVVCEGDQLPTLQVLLPSLPGVRTVVVVGDPDRAPGAGAAGGAPAPTVIGYADLLTAPAPLHDVGAGEDDLALILFTSGTTGDPKGAMLSHGGLLFSVDALCRITRMGPEDRSLGCLPYHHIFAIAVEYFVMLMAGGSIVLRDSFHPRSAAQDVERHRATFLPGVPSMFILLTELLERESFDLRSLRVGIIGGAPVPPDIQARFERMTGAVLLEGYGQTELAPLATLERLDAERRPGSAGLPVPGVEILILDPDTGEVLPPRQIGEICVRHPRPMKGYWNNPEATAEVLRGGLVHTRDLGYLDEDGYLYIVDRLTDMIIYGGFNIYPKEVELVLLSHPAVSEAAVVGLSHPTKGQVPCAYVSLKEGAQATREELLAHCRQRLAPYKVPRELHFVDEFPRTATGKIRKVDLRAQAGRTR